MDVTPLVRKGQQIIQGYSSGHFKVSGVTYSHPVLVSSARTDIWEIGEISDIQDLRFEHFSALLDQADDIDVVLLGTGRNIGFLSPDVRRALKEGGLQLDMMDTGAACRTYNVLMAEGRRVFCALLQYE